MHAFVTEVGVFFPGDSSEVVPDWASAFVVDYNLKMDHPSNDYMTAAQGHTRVPQGWGKWGWGGGSGVGAEGVGVCWVQAGWWWW
jgi:hypothetical protein